MADVSKVIWWRRESPVVTMPLGLVFFSNLSRRTLAGMIRAMRQEKEGGPTNALSAQWAMIRTFCEDGVRSEKRVFPTMGQSLAIPLAACRPSSEKDGHRKPSNHPGPYRSRTLLLPATVLPHFVPCYLTSCFYVCDLSLLSVCNWHYPNFPLVSMSQHFWPSICCCDRIK